jgi:hypothetical protein
MNDLQMLLIFGATIVAAWGYLQLCDRVRR